MQFSVEVRNAQLDAIESTIGTSPVLRLYSGSPPADTAAAATGTLIASLTLPSDWLAVASAGAKSLLGTWQANASTGGTLGYYRIWNSAISLCHEQGTVGQSVALTTNWLTAANGNVLNFTDTTGAVVGQIIAGTGVAVGSTVLAVNFTTITLSLTSSAGVATAAAITLTSHMTVDNVIVTAAQQITITAKTITAANA